MGHFYNLPPSSQGPVNSTLPIPHDPIPAQGDQPPRRQAATVLMMVAVLASWPADLEPRLNAPNDRRVQSAQTIPAPPITFVPYTRPPYGIFALNDEPYKVAFVASIVQASSNPDQPPRQYALSPATTAITLQAWQPAPPMPPRSRASVVGAFQPAVQPAPQACLSALELNQIVGAWAQAWEAQTAPKNAGWNVPPVLVSLPAPPAAGKLAQAAASWPADLEPRLSRPNDQRQTIAPLTLIYGAPPAPRSALSVSALTGIVATWAESWGTQRAPSSAAWDVPPVITYVPPVELQAHVYAASQPPEPLPVQRLQSIVPTFAAVSQPPVRGPHSPIYTIVSSWADAPVMPRAVPSAAWIATILPLHLAPNTLPWQVLTSWPADLEPRLSRPNAEQQRIAPLALAYGVPPQPQAPLSVPKIAHIVSTWAESWPAQRAPLSAVDWPASVEPQEPDEVLHSSSVRSVVCCMRRPGDLIQKDPSSVEPQGFDWTTYLAELGAGVTITDSEWSVSAIVGDAAPLAVSIGSIVTGNLKTQTTLTAGTVGARYTVTNRITTSSGVVDDRSFKVLVVQR